MNQTTLNRESETSVAAYWAARVTAWVAWIALLVVCSLMLVDYGRRIGARNPREFVRMIVGKDQVLMAEDPLDAAEYRELKAQLAANPQDEKVQQRIRELDTELREGYFGQLRFATVGAYLLVLTAVILLAASKIAGSLRRRLPMPAPGSAAAESGARQMAAARWARVGVVVVTVGIVSISVALASQVTSDLPTAVKTAKKDSPKQKPSESAAEPAVDKPADYPKEEEIAKNWPSFRGPHGAGISAYADLPMKWNGKSGENIIWKTPVPLPGNNSAIVWGDRVFLSGANKKKREIYCFDTKNGKLLWTVEAPSTPQSRGKAPRVDRATGYAAPTMVTDGRRAIAIFANGDLTAVDFEGNVLWSKGLGIPDSMYGYAASLAMHHGRVLVQFDQGAPDDKLSKLYAFDAASGKPVWRVDRPVANSWSSPIVVGDDKKAQLITAADPWAISYNPEDGKELWRAEGVMGDQGVTPVAANGLVQVGSEYSEWFAIRMNGTGNVTETHIAWQGVDGLPDTVSPLVVKDLLLLTTSNGILTCYDAAKGEMLWDSEFDAEFTSSPSLVGDHVYLIGKKGKGWVGKVTRKGWEKIAENDLGEKCVTSPAMQDGRLYVRGEKHLFCIGKTDGKAADSKK